MDRAAKLLDDTWFTPANPLTPAKRAVAATAKAENFIFFSRLDVDKVDNR
jgi:hypothetical protein